MIDPHREFFYSLYTDAWDAGNKLAEAHRRGVEVSDSNLDEVIAKRRTFRDYCLSIGRESVFTMIEYPVLVSEIGKVLGEDTGAFFEEWIQKPRAGYFRSNSVE